MLHADARGRSISTQLSQTLLIDSVEDISVWQQREISQWAQFIDRVVGIRGTVAVTLSANCTENRGDSTGSIL